MADDLLPLLGFNVGNEGDDEESDSDDGDIEEDDTNGSADEEEEEEEETVQEKIEHTKVKKKPDKKNVDSVNITFDTSLPTAHSYLGEDLEEIYGRTIHEDDSQITLPIITLPGIMLVPGQIIPLHLFHQHTVAMLKSVVDADKTFGIVAMRYDDAYNQTLASIGTTAEIYSVKDETDEASGISTIRVKARGRQRFEIIDTKRNATGVLIGTVRILPEHVMSEILEGARPPSHCKFCCCATKQDEVLKTAVDRSGTVIARVNLLNNRQVGRMTSAHFTWWPPWVYKMYDTEFLMKRIREELWKWNKTLRPENMPEKPAELSYWVAQNLPLDDSLRLHLLSINSAVQRLRCELSIIQKCSVFCCKECGQQIGNKEDVFCLSAEGPMGAYVNPGGYVHEMLTFYKAINLNLIGRPSTEHSWFPGFAWTISQCKHCSHHMGWRFTASKKSMSPQKFWGLCRSSLIPGIQNIDETGDEWLPVM